MKSKKGLWALLLSSACAGAVAAESAAAVPAASAPASAQEAPAAASLAGADLEALFAPDVEPARREAARKRAVKLALAGDARAAFDLGVLFRHGMAHPARAVERDLDTARHWLEKCVTLPHCPKFALASLAELELDAGNPRAAMQWAQAWAVLARERSKLGRVPGQSASGPSSYEAYLLHRCFERLPAAGREQTVAQAFDEFQQRWGAHLQRMVTGLPDERLALQENWAEFAAPKFNHPVLATRSPRYPFLALYLLRANPRGGRPEQVMLVEALPSPTSVLGQHRLAERFESRPYASPEPRYAFLPIESADPRFDLKKTD